MRIVTGLMGLMAVLGGLMDTTHVKELMVWTASARVVE